MVLLVIVFAVDGAVACILEIPVVGGVCADARAEGTYAGVREGGSRTMELSCEMDIWRGGGEGDGGEL
jgi:hypothetical protein